MGGWAGRTLVNPYRAGASRPFKVTNMGLLNFFKRSRYETWNVLDARGLTNDGPSIDEAKALSIPAVFACTRVLAESIASMPLVLYRKNGEGNRERAEDHPLSGLLKYSPNTFQTSVEFREFIMACLALRGNAFSYIERDNGRVTALWPLNPSTMTVETEGTRLKYRYVDRGREIPYRQDEILHVKGISTDGVLGLSPISTLRETLDTAATMQEYSRKFFRNMARPSGVLKTDETLGPEAFERLRKTWNDAHTGAGNTGKVVILEAGMEYQSIGMSNEDAETLATRKFTLEEIARAYRIPPHILGHLDRMSYNNVEQLAREFLTLTLTPWLVRIEARMTAALLTEMERQAGYYFEHVTSGILRAGTLERFQAYQIALQGGFMTPNEVRQRENLPALPGGESLGSVQPEKGDHNV